jgi:hypothetical protein
MHESDVHRNVMMFRTATPVVPQAANPQPERAHVCGGTKREGRIDRKDREVSE